MGSKNFFKNQEKTGNAKKIGEVIGNAITASGLAESAFHVAQKRELDRRFIPDVDYSKPKNFAKYGLAESYYEDAIKRIYSQYPYDGSEAEKIEFENNLTELERYLLKNKYPKATGYVTFGDTWGGTSTISDGVLGSSSSPEYIFAGNYAVGAQYDTASNKVGSLDLDFELGATVEFWLKKNSFTNPATETKYETICYITDDHDNSGDETKYFFIHTNASSPDKIYASYKKIDNTVSTTTPEFNFDIDTSLATLADSNWHHYTLAIQSASGGYACEFYLDGRYVSRTTDSKVSPDYKITGSNTMTIGSFGGYYTHNLDLFGYGKLSGSLDEFRIWQEKRTAEEIGLNYFKGVHGGVRTDTNKYNSTTPVNLGIYYKFNEGLTNDDATDSVVLDYSGHISNGLFVGYDSTSRSTGSAMTTALYDSLGISEEGDYIVRETNTLISNLQTEMRVSGSSWDYENGGSLYSMMPSWIREEDSATDFELKKLTQVMGTYFDTLHNQIGAISSLQDTKYLQTASHESATGLPEKLLESHGFKTSGYFIESDVLGSILKQDDKRNFSKDISGLKNLVYRNVYNNLSYIYKSKGTEKSFRNLFRCFGVDQDLIKLKLYGDNSEVHIRDDKYSTLVNKKALDFSGISNEESRASNIFNYENSSGDTGYIPSQSSADTSITIEAELVFPKFASNTKNYSALARLTTSSLFGLHSAATDGTDTTFQSPDYDFQVYAIKDNKDRVKFLLTSSNGVFPELSSSFYPTSTSDFENVYNNSHWVFAVRLSPNGYPYYGTIEDNEGYNLEFYGVNYSLSEKVRSFSVSGSVSYATGSAFLTGSNKRLYLGAHRTNFTGSLQTKSDVKALGLRYWESYLSESEIDSHCLDSSNFGLEMPSRNAYLFEDTAGNYNSKIDSLALSWDFSLVTSSSVSGTIEILNSFGYDGINSYHAKGQNFPNSTQAYSYEYLNASKTQIPENLYSSDLVDIRNYDDVLFGPQTRGIRHFFSIETSMYDIISDNIMQFFSSVIEYNTLVGNPVESFRTRYKGLEKLRGIFFKRIQNSPDLDKFVQVYKFLDSAIDSVLYNMIPASVASSEQVRTIVESHILERNKHPRRLNIIKDSTPDTAQIGEKPQGGTDDGDGSDSVGDSTTTKKVIVSKGSPVPAPSISSFSQPDLSFEEESYVKEEGNYDPFNPKLNDAPTDDPPPEYTPKVDKLPANSPRVDTDISGTVPSLPGSDPGPGPVPRF